MLQMRYVTSAHEIMRELLQYVPRAKNKALICKVARERERGEREKKRDRITPSRNKQVSQCSRAGWMERQEGGGKAPETSIAWHPTAD